MNRTSRFSLFDWCLLWKKSRTALLSSWRVLAGLFLIFPVLHPGAALPPASLPLYDLTSLGTLKGADYSVAVRINDRGRIVGTSRHPFLWEQGRMIDLAGIPDATGGAGTGYANDINSKGQIVGSSGSYGPVVMSGLRFAEAFLYSRGEIHRLGDPQDEDIEAFGINDKGQVVGLHDYRAFLYENGRFTDLKTLSTRPRGNGSRAARINHRGEIAGATTVNRSGGGDLPVHGFLWRRGRMLDLGTLPFFENSTALALNDRGQVVGFTSHTAYWRQAELGEPGHAFLWKRGHLTDLGTLKSAADSQANAINDQGIIVGESGGHAVLWWNRRIYDLNDLISKGSDWTLVQALDINETGRIVGAGRLPGSQELQAFLLTPKSDPREIRRSNP